jgi:hypothetical protein
MIRSPHCTAAANSDSVLGLDPSKCDLVVGSAASVAFDHAGRSASQPRALQDTAVRSEGPLSPDRSGRAGAVPSAYLREAGSTDKSQVHRGKIKRGSAHTPIASGQRESATNRLGEHRLPLGWVWRSLAPERAPTCHWRLRPHSSTTRRDDPESGRVPRARSRLRHEPRS